MAGYIGKIAAVVTANTSDLSRKLNKSAEEANRFASRLKSSIDRAGSDASSSLQKIFTPLQKLERNLQAASSRALSLNLPVDQIRAFVSAAEQINKPIEGLQGGFTRLSADVQAELLPALNRVQNQALLINRRIEETGTASQASFDIATRTIDKTTQAFQRLAQAQSIAGQGLTGRELQFTDPSVFNALTRTASLTKKAGALPPSVLADGTVTGKVKQLASLSDQIELQFARLENLRLSPRVDTTQVEAAEQKLMSLVAETEQVQDSLDKIVSLDDRVKALGFRDGSPKGPYGPPPPEDQKLARASGGLNILSEFDVEVSRTKANMQEIRQEALKLGEAFDSVSNQRFFDASIFRKQQGELSALRDTIGRVGADVRGPLEAAFSSYAATVSNALDRGERGFNENTQEIQRQRAELIKLIAATGQVGNVGNITAGVNRAGDIGRAGFDKFSLALNQAAFAVDDFLSSTGGLEFKLRAVQNNVTQLAFILGNTKGLFIGLAAVIGTQLVIGLLKANGLLEEERDVLDALNDAFREQEQRVAALAESYDRLGESIRDAGLDDAGRTQAGRQRELDNIRRQEEEARVARAAAVDPEVERLRTELARLEREKEESDSAARRVALEAQAGEVRTQIQARSRIAGERRSTPESVERTLRNQGQAAIETLIAALREAILRAGGDPEGAVGRNAIQQRRSQLQSELDARLAAVDFADSQQEAAALSEAIKAAEQELARYEGGLGGLADVTGEIEAELRAQLEALAAENAALEARIRDAAPGEAFIRVTEAAFGVADTLDRARADLDSAGIGRTRAGDVLTRVNAEINRLRDEAQQARNEGDVERLNQIEGQIRQVFGSLANSAAAAAGGLAVFSDVISRIGDDLNETVLGEVRGRAEQARRLRNEAGAAIGLNGIGGNFANADGFIANEVERRARAEARRAEDEAARVQEENTRLRQEFVEDAISGVFGNDPRDAVDALIAERRRIQQQIDSGDLGFEEEQAAARRQREIDRELGRMFEDSAAGRKARANADAADSAAAEARLRADSAARGERLLQSDAEQAARGVVQALQDIQNATQLRFDSGLGIPPNADQEARTRVLDEARRSAAPALFALQDAVANAVLQGPSRQALNAADISTQQGTAELNRLLRGDDPARDQNLLELQKQTSELVKLNATLGAAGVAD